MYEDKKSFGAVLGWVLFGFVILGVLIGLSFGVPAFGRYQTLQNENNNVQVNEIRIRQQEQLIKVEQQKAEIRIVDAQGIAKSQAIISSSLTNAYLQYLSIEAQKSLANSQNHTTIYIPVGDNGLPLVKTVD